MHVRFDIYSVTYTNPVWLDSVPGLKAAIAVMEKIAQASPGRYYVFDFQDQTVIASIDTTDHEVNPEA